MNLTFIDWFIAASCIFILFLVVRLSRSFVKSVADFLTAGRSAGRYMITVSQGNVGWLHVYNHIPEWADISYQVKVTSLGDNPVRTMLITH